MPSMLSLLGEVSVEDLHPEVHLGPGGVVLPWGGGGHHMVEEEEVTTWCTSSCSTCQVGQGTPGPWSSPWCSRKAANCRSA